jgi:alpha-N-arabinofuranosidase
MPIKHFCGLLMALIIPVAANGQDAGRDSVTTQIVIHADRPGATIAPQIYGHFAEHLGRCIYEGIWVGPESPIPNTRGIRTDVVAALKNINIPVLRWPGGCFADEYHWRDGIGPREQRPKRINTHWGGVIETNGFGTHEFLDLCEQLGCDAYISANVGSGTPAEMVDWIEYMTSDSDSTLAKERRKNGRDKPWKIRYLGVGNESWGCGGNMRPEYYADEYRRFATFANSYSGNRIFKVACGSNGEDFNWTDIVMKQVGARNMNGISLHWYTLPTGNWQTKGKATDFPPQQWDSTLMRAWRMEALLEKHLATMDKYDAQHRVGLCVDEWGTWYDQEPGSHPGFLYQQNSIRDAVVAAVNLNLFNNHADRVAMANIAQTINVLQAMILTDKEKMILTPTYHVFEMFKVHQGATLLPTDNPAADHEVENGTKVRSVYASASKDAKGLVHVSLVNARHDTPANQTLKLEGIAAKKVSGRVLTSDKLDGHNTFDQPDTVKPAVFNGAEVKAGGEIAMSMPARSVIVLEVQ